MMPARCAAASASHDVDRDRQRLGERQRTGAREAIGERLAFEILEDEELVVAVAADVEERADVRMLQRRDGARFALEALAQLRVGGERVGQDLDGDGAIEPRVTRAVDLAHPARAERRDDLVRAEPRTRGDSHGAAGLSLGIRDLGFGICG